MSVHFPFIFSLRSACLSLCVYVYLSIHLFTVFYIYFILLFYLLSIYLSRMELDRLYLRAQIHQRIMFSTGVLCRSSSFKGEWIRCPPPSYLRSGYKTSIIKTLMIQYNDCFKTSTATKRRLCTTKCRLYTTKCRLYSTKCRITIRR